MDIKEFKQNLPAGKALIGIDFGTKRLGIAVSDINRSIANSYKILYRTNLAQDIALIEKILLEKEVGGIVYGLPLQMDGSEGEIAALVREFAQKVYAQTGLPYLFWDERLSSLAVENFLIKEVDLSRSKRKKILDASAAAYILQGALDAINYINLP